MINQLILNILNCFKIELLLEEQIKILAYILIIIYYQIKSIFYFQFLFSYYFFVIFSYSLSIIIISNHETSSDSLLVKTLEEGIHLYLQKKNNKIFCLAPPIPSRNNIKTKIVLFESKSDEYTIDFDLSLFSNQYGFVNLYQIYVRQGYFLSFLNIFFRFFNLDQNNNSTKLNSIGTYIQSLKNNSIDYLAKEISIKSQNSNNYKKRI